MFVNKPLINFYVKYLVDGIFDELLILAACTRGTDQTQLGELKQAE